MASETSSHPQGTSCGSCQIRGLESEDRKRSKSRSARARSIAATEAKPASKRAASRPPPKSSERGRFKMPTIQSLNGSLRHERGTSLSTQRTHQPCPLLHPRSPSWKIVKDYPLDSWAMVNFHVAAYCRLTSEKYPFTHPRQLAPSTVRRDARLSHRWLCWRCQIPNDKTTNYPHVTSKYAFKTEGEVGVVQLGADVGRHAWRLDEGLWD